MMTALQLETWPHTSALLNVFKSLQSSRMGARAMPIIPAIKIERLLLALGITLLIADTVPDPSLSTGVVEPSRHRVQAELMRAGSTARVVAGVNR
jgi:hypothetical protein